MLLKSSVFVLFSFILLCHQLIITKVSSYTFNSCENSIMFEFASYEK